jgi:ethanolamine kinase
VNHLPGLSKTELDEDAILLRAYGKGTDVLIDRESTFMNGPGVLHF